MWYSQNDSRWSGQRLGTCDGITIGSDGCYVTAFANMANDCGKDITPARLDDIFTNSGYVQGCLCTDNMLSAVYPDIVYQESRSYSDAADLNYLNNDIHVKQIVMIDADDNPGNGVNTHFMYFYDIHDGAVRVIDSWTGNLINVADVYGDPSRVIYKIVTYRFDGYPEAPVQPPVVDPAPVEAPPHIEPPVAPEPTEPTPKPEDPVPPIVPPVPVNKPKGESMNLSRYNKLWIALGGAVVAMLINHLGANSPYTLDAIALLTAAGVYQVPNK